MTTQLTFLPDLQARKVADFRPIHYLGGKRRLLEAISAAVDDVRPESGTLLDLFAGTGTVAAHFAQEREVLAVDIQEYSRVLCSAALSPDAPEVETTASILGAAGEEWLALGRSAIRPLLECERLALNAAEMGGDPDELCDIVEHGSVVGRHLGGSEPRSPRVRAVLDESVRRIRALPTDAAEKLTITAHYGGVYFSFDQSLELDLLLSMADLLPEQQRDTWLAAALATASEVVTSVGNHFAQPIRPRNGSGHIKSASVQAILGCRRHRTVDVFEKWLDRYRSLPRLAAREAAIQSDFREYLSRSPQGVTVVYADPPYTRDHYSRFYHVLETMALRDRPGMSMAPAGGEAPRPSRGLYRTDRHQSPFCVKSRAPTAFAQLFAGVRRMRVPLVLSYSPYSQTTPSHPRLMTVGQLRELASAHFREVRVSEVAAARHSKLNAAHL